MGNSGDRGGEDDDINKFLYGDEVEEIQQHYERQSIKDDTEKQEQPTEEKEGIFEEGSEDELEIVLDGDSKRGLTNISLSQQQKTQSQSAAGVSTAQQQREIATLDPAAFGAALGMLNGQSIYDVDLDSEYGGPAADKPWRKPGADITDYFNFGFNETTWRMYCIKQRMLREEYGNAKNNNIPPVLLNNPMILQGLYPKGNVHFSSPFVGLPPQHQQQLQQSAQQPSYHQHYQQKQPSQYHTQHHYQQQPYGQSSQYQQQAESSHRHPQQQQQPQQQQPSSYRRRSRSRSREPHSPSQPPSQQQSSHPRQSSSGHYNQYDQSGQSRPSGSSSSRQHYSSSRRDYR